MGAASDDDGIALAVNAAGAVYVLSAFQGTVDFGGGALISAGGAPAAMYLQFANPDSAFNLNYSISVLAMSLIGGTAHWIGPVIGAIVLASTQQFLAVTISSEINVLVLGFMLVLFVVAAPKGIIGLVGRLKRKGGEA